MNHVLGLMSYDLERSSVIGSVVYRYLLYDEKKFFGNRFRVQFDIPYPLLRSIGIASACHRLW